MSDIKKLLKKRDKLIDTIEALEDQLTQIDQVLEQAEKEYQSDQESESAPAVSLRPF